MQVTITNNCSLSIHKFVLLCKFVVAETKIMLNVKMSIVIRGYVSLLVEGQRLGRNELPPLCSCRASNGNTELKRFYVRFLRLQSVF